MNSIIQTYCSHGFALIPLERRSKKAAVKWGEFQNRKPTDDELNAWFTDDNESNLAIVTGAISGVVVVDFDGEAGEASLQKLELPKTPTVRTAHGRHLYFKHPGFSVGNSVRVMPGVDIRGDGAYAVAPPSVHPEGQPYTWEISLDEAPLAELPKAVLNVLSRPWEEQAVSVSRSETAMPRAVRAEVDRLLGELQTTTKGSRNDQLNKTAFALGQFAGFGYFDTEWAGETLTEVAQSIGLTRDEIRATIESGLAAGLKQPKGIGGEVWEILDANPEIMDRPIRLIHGQVYAATWVPIGSNQNGEAKTEKELVVIDGNGQLYSKRDIPGACSIEELPFDIDLPHVPLQSKLLSPAALKAFVARKQVDPAGLFKQITDSVNGFISFENSLADQRGMCATVACWIMGTYMTDAFDVVGYVWPTGERGSGKTQLLNTVSALAYLGRTITSGSSFAAIRDEAHYGATIAFDDCEDVRKMENEKRELLLAGNTRGTVVTLKESIGESQWQTRYINNFAPRLFSSIGIPDPVLGSRTISVPLISTTDRAKTQKSPARMDDWPHDLRKMIDDLWLCAVTHLNRVRDCDVLACEKTELYARGHDIWRMPLAIAYWLDHDHGATGLFQDVTSISVAYQDQVQDIQGIDINGIVLNALFQLVEDSGVSVVVKPTGEILDRVKAMARSMDQDSAEFETLTVQRLGWLLKRLSFEKAKAHGQRRSWLIDRKRVSEVAASRSHRLTSSPSIVPEQGAAVEFEYDRFGIPT